MKKINHCMSLLLMAFLLLSVAHSQAQIKKTASVEGITEYMLDNGLKVLMFPDNSSQTVPLTSLIK